MLPGIYPCKTCTMWQPFGAICCCSRARVHTVDHDMTSHCSPLLHRNARTAPDAVCATKTVCSLRRTATGTLTTHGTHVAGTCRCPQFCQRSASCSRRCRTRQDSTARSPVTGALPDLASNLAMMTQLLGSISATAVSSICFTHPGKVKTLSCASHGMGHEGFHGLTCRSNHCGTA